MMKNRMKMMAAGCVLGMVFSAQAEVVTEGLVSWWKCDDGSGTEAVDSSGENHLEFVNTPEWGAGVSGGALQFTKDDKDYARVYEGSLNITKAITLEAWIKGDSLPRGSAHRPILSKREPWYLSVFQGKPFFMWRGSKGDFSVQGRERLKEGEWYHIVATYDQSHLSVYVNGELSRQTKAEGVRAHKKTTYLEVGSYNAGQMLFDGLIDEIRIYNRALTPEEILQNYLATQSVGSVGRSDGGAGSAMPVLCSN